MAVKDGRIFGEAQAAAGISARAAPATADASLSRAPPLAMAKAGVGGYISSSYLVYTYTVNI